MGVEVIDRDRTYRLVQEEVAALGRFRAAFGFLGPSALSKHPEGEVLIIDIGVFHEFGTVNMPARPIIRETFEQHGDAILAEEEAQVGKVLDGKRKAKDAVRNVARFAAKRMRETIKAAGSWAESLAAETIARKGHSTPLLDTGALLDAVAWAVMEGDTIIEHGTVA